MRYSSRAERLRVADSDGRGRLDHRSRRLLGFPSQRRPGGPALRRRILDVAGRTTLLGRRGAALRRVPDCRVSRPLGHQGAGPNQCWQTEIGLPSGVQRSWVSLPSLPTVTRPPPPLLVPPTVRLPPLWPSAVTWA